MIEDKNMSKTPLSALGEFGLIDHLTKNFKIQNPETKMGVGDDACVLAPSAARTVVSTDILTEGVHFNLQYTPLKHLGYKAVVVNLSDIIAMGAIPKQILVSIAVSNRFTVEALDEIYAGIFNACKRYKVDLVGGDTTTSQSGLVISITAIGEVEEKDIIYRSGAKPTDLIVVSGNLGAAYAGLQVLERENKIWQQNPDIQPNLEEFPYVLEKQLKPEARLDILEQMKEKNIIPTSMIDISDGLLSEILHITKSSNVGVRIYDDKLPIDYETIRVAEELNMAPQIYALNGGEDYELLFTVPLDKKDEIESIKDLKIIGYVTDKDQGTRLITKNGEETEIIAPTWQDPHSV